MKVVSPRENISNANRKEKEGGRPLHTRGSINFDGGVIYLNSNIYLTERGLKLRIKGAANENTNTGRDRGRKKKRRRDLI